MSTTMRKIKQLANNAFVRPDRTEVLTQNLQESEKRIDQIKTTCETLAKKIHDCLQGRGKDGQVDKRIRKVPEYLLGSAMVSNGKTLGDGSILGEVLQESGEIEIKLGQAVIDSYEMKIEESILKPLQSLMDNDLPNIYKLKRNLAKCTADMDSAKAKHNQATRHSMTAGQGSKVENTKEEWEETQLKVEQCRDTLATEMNALIARESEIAKLVVDFLNYQKEYHFKVFSILEELILSVDNCVSTSKHKPVYGQELGGHLHSSQITIAYPIELCVCGLIVTGLEEEGLFRIAGSSSKVKKLKSAIDARLMNLDMLLTEFVDPHVIANALKCYLRELPEPLLTFKLHDDWVNAIRIQDNSQKQEALLHVLKHLPQPNYDNLRYLVKFLKELSNHQDVNKMTPPNIAIVIAPNLLWPNASASADDLTGNNSTMGMNMTMTHIYSSVLDQLIANCSYFFPEEIDFFITFTKPDSTPEPSCNGAAGVSEELTDYQNKIKRSNSNSSVDEQSPHGGSPKPVVRRKNKPAPTPPAAPPNKNPLANMRPFSGMTTTNSTSTKSGAQSKSDPDHGKALSKDKRAGVWIPPSPKETTRKKMDGVGSAPMKPPPPKTAKNKFMQESFKGASPTQSLESPDDKGSGSSKMFSSTTDNVSSSPLLNSTFNFGSLPRNFQTENSHKGAIRARPPSMLGIPPPVPPPVASSVANNYEQGKSDKESQSSSSDSERDKISPLPATGGQGLVDGNSNKILQPPVAAPVPAPRPSLVHSQSIKESTASDAPVQRERPSIMAKPRDISRKNFSNHSHSANSSSTTPHQEVVEDVSGGEGKKVVPSQLENQDNREVAAICGVPPPDPPPSPLCNVSSVGNAKSYEVIHPPVSPLPSPVFETGGGNPPNRPPRPQPPAPPKTPKLPGMNESTDL